MVSITQDTPNQSNSHLWYGVLTVLFLAGFASAIVAGALQPAEAGAFHLLDVLGGVKAFCAIVVGIGLLLLLMHYAEAALALFFLVGLVKGDPSLAAAPVDLTVLTATILAMTVVWKLLTSERVTTLPREYFLYLPLLAMMVISLSYTPNFSAGLEKVLRFICLTGIGIVAPFILIDSAAKMRRCLYVLVIGGIALAFNSLTMLGDSQRFVAPSGLNTELGAASAVALIILWGLAFPRLSFGYRLLFYPILGVLVVALLGSGGRFANVSTALCVVIGALMCRRLLKDLAVLGGIALISLPLVLIPSASYQYLESLRHPTMAMGTRNDLMWLGLKVFLAHPLLGVGVDGFRFVSPNPITYNFPHNLILELGAEMGVIAALSFVLIAFSSFREAIRQLLIADGFDAELTRTVFLLLIYATLDSMISGDMNDLRFTWFVLGLPFVLRILRADSLFYASPALETADEVSPDATPA
ncbi:MAG TPA: O-antigen ligase family protein [Verrucomicrobiae bacterium]|nr:O-antigen ligase family protein [Verrucomicrobiae bacterium]